MLPSQTLTSAARAPQHFGLLPGRSLAADLELQGVDPLGHQLLTGQQTTGLLSDLLHLLARQPGLQYQHDAHLGALSGSTPAETTPGTPPTSAPICAATSGSVAAGTQACCCARAHTAGRGTCTVTGPAGSTTSRPSASVTDPSAARTASIGMGRASGRQVRRVSMLENTGIAPRPSGAARVTIAADALFSPAGPPSASSSRSSR